MTEINQQKIPDNRITKHILAFGRVLRRAGLDVSTGQIMDAMRALELIGIREQNDVYQAFYSVFVTRQEQVDLFDQAFHLFWRAPSKLPQMRNLILPGLELLANAQSQKSWRVQQALSEIERQQQQNKSRRENEKKEAIELVLTYSPLEVLHKKDFAAFSIEELMIAKRLLAEMRWPISPKRTRRFLPHEKGRFIDLRRTMRKSLRHQGEMVKLSWQKRDTKPRDIAILCDISGSMERYSRLLLHFMHAFTNGMRRVETFVFGTRLTRITHYLRQRDIDEAISSVSHIVNDWAGGTRIGESLKQFNFLWLRRVLRSGAVVMIISDGWDRGDIPLLQQEIARLSRSCFRLIWLNPHLGYDSYEPLTRGIQAALPYIDDFLPLHNLESLQQLGKKLTAIMKNSPNSSFKK